MFKPEDFEMPLEKQLRIRVIDKEIDECNDIDALRENLKQCACISNEVSAPAFSHST